MLNREIEWPFELFEILVVVNEPIYHAPDEILLVYAVESKSQFELGQSLAANSITKARLRVLRRGCAA